MRNAKIRALYKSIMASLDGAVSEAMKCRNDDVRYYVEEAQELLSVLVEGYNDEDPEELDFD